MRSAIAFWVSRQVDYFEPVMPTISWFYGIAIRMYVRDHPPPHFHAIYGEHEANVSIETGEVIEGGLPKVAARLVKEWALVRQSRLSTMEAPDTFVQWMRARYPGAKI